MLNSAEWGKFKIGDLFNTDLWEYGKNKQWQTRFENDSKNRYPVISGITVNNGVNYYTEDIPNYNEIFYDSLTISTRGEYSGTVTYHDGKFVLANNILVMYMPNLSKNQKLFIGSIINGLNYGGYNNYPRIETLKKDFIKLPIKNGIVDYDFMEDFINRLEEQRIKQLGVYLQETGLEDYELTKEEKNALFEYKHIKFKEYNIIDLFDIKNTKSILSRDIVENSGIDPYLCASNENNAVSTYIKYKENLKDEGNCIFIGGKTFVVTYQESDFYSNDSHNLALYLKNIERNRYTQLYFATCINKSLNHKYSWGDSVSKAKIKHDKVLIPTISDELNEESIKNFMSAICKLILKDIVLYKDIKLECTKRVIENNNNDGQSMAAEDIEKYKTIDKENRNGKKY